MKIHGRIKFSILCSRFQNTAMEGISSPNSLTYVDEDHVRPSKMPKLKTIPEKKGITTRSHAKTSALLDTVKSKLVTKAKMSEAAKATLSKSSSRSSSDSSFKSTGTASNSNSRSSSPSFSCAKKVVSFSDQKERSSRPRVKEAKQRSLSRSKGSSSSARSDASPVRMKSLEAKKQKLKKRALVKSSQFLDPTNKDGKLRRNKVGWREVAVFNSEEDYESSTVCNTIRYFSFKFAANISWLFVS